MPRALAGTAGLLLLLTLLPGCKRPSGTVRGQVVGINPQTQQPQPLNGGRIRFFFQGEMLSADIRDGKFEAAGLPVGEAAITVESPPDAAAAPGAPPSIPVPRPLSQIDSTTLKWQVMPGEQEVTVSLADGKVEARPPKP